MSDILLLLGVALCALSVLMAIGSVLRTRPPRAAAIALVLGIILMFAGARLAPGPFGVETLTDAGQRLIDGQISLETAAAPDAAPDAGAAPAPAPAPVAAPAATEGQPSQ